MFRHEMEIARSPEAVFAYVDQLERHGEWQEQIEKIVVETPGPVGVGTRVRETRRMGSRVIDVHWEVTEHVPSSRFAFRGISGPLRPLGIATIEQIDQERSRLVLDFQLQGHGIGKLLAPLANRQARKDVARAQQRLKEKLEAGA